MSVETEESSQYKEQLEIINNLLNSTQEGSERDELISLKQNIEELLALTDEALKNNELNNSASLADDFIEPNSNSSNNSGNNPNIDEEYALFMAEMEGAAFKAADVDNEPKIDNGANLRTEKYKDLEGKKFKAPHKHQWGQLMYHNAMICSVSDDGTDSKELLVKVLFLNPTHNEMLPCPYYFDLEKDCRFNEEQCRFSHGEFVPFDSLQKYIEPNFEDLTIGSNVLAKQEDNLWYKAKITRIKKEKCFVKFESKNVRIKQNEEILFKDIFPLDCGENLNNNTSEEDSGNEEKASIEKDPKAHQVELINKSLLINPGFTRLGEWEQYTKGIGSRLMQKMGYIVGTGLGKGGSGIVNPVSAIVLPQGKSLDFCMNLKEQRNDPELFNAERVARQKTKKKFGKRLNRLQKKVNFEQLELDKYIEWNLKYNKEVVKNEEYNMLKDKLRNSTNEETNVANFIVEKRFKELKKIIEDLKLKIQRLEELHQEPKTLYRTFNERSIELKRINEYKKIIDAEIDRRKNNKEMAVF